ncbi:MAG: exodeoxyribonuclease VII small subunit [Elusimicrobiota bacterium]
MTQKKKKPDTESFENALEKLEEITEKLSGGALTLEESVKLFEEGMKLKKTCNKKLAAAEKKIKILIEDEDGFREGDFKIEEDD